MVTLGQPHLSNPRVLIPSGHWLADFPSGIEVGKGCVAAHPVSHAFVSSSNTFKRNVELEDMLTVSLPSIRVSHISRVDYATYREVQTIAFAGHFFVVLGAAVSAVDSEWSQLSSSCVED